MHALLRSVLTKYNNATEIPPVFLVMCFWSQVCLTQTLRLTLTHASTKFGTKTSFYAGEPADRIELIEIVNKKINDETIDTNTHTTIEMK